MIDERALNIFTDGSSRPKPRRGGVGIGFIFVNDSGVDVREDVALPGYKGVSSNEMELMACALALRQAPAFLSRQGFSKIIIFTDSDYIVLNHRNAMFVWPNSKWHRVSGAPVLNAGLWKDLVREMKRVGLRVEFQKVKAHSQDEDNKAVDRLAKDSGRLPLNAPITPSIVRRKKSGKRTRLGSVERQGQRITIRIVQCQYLKV